MSAFLPEYLNHLRERLDETDDDIPAEQMTEEVRQFFDRLFLEALAVPATKIKTPKPTKVLPSPEKVIVFYQRFWHGQSMFHKKDRRWEDEPARRKVTERAANNGNALKVDFFLTEPEGADE